MTGSVVVSGTSTRQKTGNYPFRLGEDAVQLAIWISKKFQGR
jgi:hypothetical protein